ncbi:MAG: protein kinase [Catenulispora sp.]|nr:protein kinase [Catenulispora sp.]
MAELPEMIDGWRVVQQLGEGDFATVYKVIADDVEYALKLCHANNEAAQDRLELEKDSLAKLDHESIPKLISSGTYSDRAYFVMTIGQERTLKAAIEDNERAGAVYGDIRAMGILAKLLDAVNYMHSKGLVHRDIKDANVLANTSGSAVTLIDFGFCKSVDDASNRTGDSFWRAGAPRFSPPSKLRSPGKPEPTHDVFAVGVIGYRLLTGEYPWSVGAHEDRSALLDVLLNQSALPVRERNSYVAPQVSNLISKLLDLDDNNRVSAAEALEEVNRFLSEPHAKLERGKSRLAYPHVRRDPLYGDIWLTDYERRVLDTQEMQRLRFIRQLGLTNRIYDSAEHNRLSHSVGSVARVEQVLRTIEDQEGVKIDDEIRLTSRLYALTHDVGHIPFGHTLEDEFNFFPRHDQNHRRIERLIFRSTSELGQVFRENEVGRATRALFEPEALLQPGGAVVDLVSGLTGADVLDYIDRDAYFCGLSHRIDSAIFRQFRLYPLPKSDDRRLISMVGGEYGVRIDREFAVENLLEARYAMFLKVYANESKIAISALLAKGLSEAIIPSTGRSTIREENLEQLGVSDDVILDRMKQSKRPVVKWAADKIIQRKLPRGVYRAVLVEKPNRTDHNYRDQQIRLSELGLFDPRRRAVLEAALARSAQLEPHQVMIYCPEHAPGYSKVEYWVTQTRDASPTLQEPSFGSQVKGRHLGLWELWVFVADSPNSRAEVTVAGAAQDRFGYPNLIGFDRLQGRHF